MSRWFDVIGYHIIVRLEYVGINMTDHYGTITLGGAYLGSCMASGVFDPAAKTERDNNACVDWLTTSKSVWSCLETSLIAIARHVIDIPLSECPKRIW
jgi:hypothetical protein